MQRNKTYQSILNQLESMPSDYLQEVNAFLKKLTKVIQKKKLNRIETMKLAGSWVDMSDKEFEEYLASTQKIRSEMFDRNFEL